MTEYRRKVKSVRDVHNDIYFLHFSYMTDLKGENMIPRAEIFRALCNSFGCHYTATPITRYFGVSAYSSACDPGTNLHNWNNGAINVGCKSFDRKNAEVIRNWARG